jgi:hypothetical protein
MRKSSVRAWISRVGQRSGPFRSHFRRGLRGAVLGRLFDLVWRYPPRDVAHLACAKRGKVSSDGFGTRDVEEVRDRMANQKKPLCLPGS